MFSTKKTPARYGAYCLHVAQSVLFCIRQNKFVASPVLRRIVCTRQNETKTDVRKGRENCSRTKIKFGKGVKNLSDRENNVRKGGATLHNTKNDAWKRAQRCSDAKITLFSKIHTTMKRKTSILRLYYKTISIPSYAKRVSGKTACASRRRASNSVYRDEK